MKKKFQHISLIALALILPFSLPGASVSAANAVDWKPGRIIDDEIFTNAKNMSISDIQAFLSKNVGTGGYASIPGQCDTQGGLSAAPYSNSTRAEYARSLGREDKFTCLNIYYEVPKTAPGPDEPASNYGGAPIPAGAQSAAQIIANAAVKYNISPKVLLVKLATESPGPLTSDDWPFRKQYLYAMGAHCPDSGPGGSANCDVNYSGFSLQIDEAASLLRWYLDSMTQSWWQYKKPYQNNYVLWTVDGRVDANGAPCGGNNVFIETKATAALYTYTPYQPNQAALSNMYGTGDSCSAYGNRNFWRVFNDWFGSTLIDCKADEPILPQVYRLYNPNTYEHFYTAYQCEINVLTKRNGFQNLGAAFNTTLASQTWAVPILRLYNPSKQLHFWTSSVEESNSLQQSLGYQYEGIAYYTLNPTTSSTYPIYRIYNPKTHVHLWTASLSEADNANRYGGYRYEGPAFYSQ